MDPSLGQEPVPPPGRNVKFDRYVRQTFGDVDSSNADVRELRRAAWATWKTSAPSTRQPSADDGELARAIALSVQDQGSSSRPIVLDDDDDDEIQLVMAMSAAEAKEPAPSRQQARHREGTPDEEKRMLEEALAASMQEAKVSPEVVDDSDADEHEEAVEERTPKRVKLDTKSEVEIPSAAPVPGPSNGLKALGIDRAQLERERLARQAARAGASTSAAAGPSKPPTGSSHPRPTKPQAREHPQTSARLPNHPLQSKGPLPQDAAGEYHLDGELRHVRLRIGQPSSSRTFSIRDIFREPSQMSLVIVSSFVWDFDWLETFMPDPAVVPTVRVVRPPGRTFNEKRALQGKLQPMPDGAVHAYPDMDGKSGSEHMKYAWIFYKTGRLRVAIMTANLLAYDYEEIENTIFIQDFLPKGRTLGCATTAPDAQLPDFPDQFRQLFVHLKIHKALRRLASSHPQGPQLPIAADESFSDFGKYDWSRVQVRLVMSIPGQYNGFPKMVASGICRLAKVIEEEGWVPRKGERVEAEYQGSSLGGYYIDWFTRFYQSLGGMDLVTMARQPKALSWPPIKVIFPSLATVDASVLGRPGGGTMFCGKSFEKHPQLFYDANSKSGGVLMHTKMIIVTFEKQSSGLGAIGGKRKADEIEEDTDDDGVGGWIYVGSHNFSPSAWGTVNFKNTPATLNISNYEMGIVFPLPRRNTSSIADNVAAHKRPPRPYGKTDEPWSQDKYLPREG